MQDSRAKLLYNRNSSDEYKLVQQLEREIQCLERQLCRLQAVDVSLDSKTCSTYEDMISSRKAMLNELQAQRHQYR